MNSSSSWRLYRLVGDFLGKRGIHKSQGTYSSSGSGRSSRFKFQDDKSSQAAAQRTGGPTPFEYTLLAFPATAFGLGIWQTQRKAWKQDLIAELDSKSRSVPVALPESIPEIESLEYRPVSVVGTFDHSREHYIGPRSLLSGGQEQESRGLSSNPEGIGWHVVTPFKITEGSLKGQEILVNRGWVAQSKLRPETRPQGQVEGEVSISGIVRKTEGRAQFAPKNQVDSSQWQYRDLPALAEKLGTLPVFVDAGQGSTVPGGPLGGQTKVALRDEHLSYMITWFSLSGISTFMWYHKFFRRLK